VPLIKQETLEAWRDEGRPHCRALAVAELARRAAEKETPK